MSLKDNTNNGSPKTCLLDLLKKNPDTLKILMGLKSIEPASRLECCESTYQLLKSWFYGFGSPKEASVLQNPVVLNDFSHWGDTSMFFLIEEQFPDLLRLQLTSPLKDVRIWCCQILTEFHTLGMKIPRPMFSSPSSFIPWHELTYLHNYWDDPTSTITTLFTDHFHKWGRLENYIALMGFHPEYLETYLKLFHHIIIDNCPLPFVERDFICIMAAANHRCTHLMRFHILQFLLHDGDISWLQSPHQMPKRLQSLQEINRILAHRPWSIKPEHIQAVTHASVSPEGTYSLSELMHAIALLCHTNALCSFLWGCGCTPELDDIQGHTYAPIPLNNQETFNGGFWQSTQNGHSSSAQTSTNNKTASSVSHNNGQSHNGHHNNEDENLEEMVQVLREMSTLENQYFTEEEVLIRFHQLLNDNKSIFSSLNGPINDNLDPLIENLLTDPEYHYEPLTVAGSDENEIFRIQDFNWEIDGVTLADNCLTDLGVLLNERFVNIYDLTYCTFGHHFEVDTSSFRRALWNFVHSLYFIRHDDYNYLGVERLLTWPLRCFIYRVIISPSTVLREHFDAALNSLKSAEKVQVVLHLIEARLQATLLYSRAIKRSMTSLPHLPC